jgi:hypothetical protein
VLDFYDRGEFTPAKKNKKHLHSSIKWDTNDDDDDSPLAVPLD